jgi:hypothetical protein
MVLIGEPVRADAFQRALAEEGLPKALVVPWPSLVRGGSALIRAIEASGGAPRGPTDVRIDSPGADFAVTRGLLRRGYARAAAEGVSAVSPEAVRRLRPRFGRVLAPRQRHLGLLAVLDDIAGALEPTPTGAPRCRAFPAPDEVATLFDKRVTSRRYAAAGLPVPTPLDGVDTLEILRDRLAQHLGCAAFVKLASGSSGACIAMVRIDRAGRLSAITTLRRTPEGGLANTRRLQLLDDPADLDATVGFLLSEGAQVEASVDKATLDGAPFDLRVLVIGGRPAFVVGRASAEGGPITNLHLGGARIDADRVRAALAPGAWDAVLDTACRVAALHPGCLHLGVDVLVEPDLRSHRVLEANAFGDWLPGLQRDGLDVHRWEIRALRARGQPSHQQTS